MGIFDFLRQQDVNLAGGFRFYDAVMNDRALTCCATACGMDEQYNKMSAVRVASADVVYSSLSFSNLVLSVSSIVPRESLTMPSF